MHRAPMAPVDAVLVAALAGSTSLDHAARFARELGDTAGPLRFVDVAVFSFRFGDGAVYLTPTDAIAMASAAILFIRFLAWAIAPVVRAVRAKGES